MEIILTVVSMLIISIFIEVMIHYGKIAWAYWKTRDVTAIINGKYVRIYDDKFIGSTSC